MSRTLKFNLNHKNNVSLTEDVYSDFSNDVYFLMQALHGGSNLTPNISVTGNQSQIMSFFSALQREKRYMDSYVKHGLNDAQTMTSKYQLDDAVRKFEYETGLRWPFTQ
jgi:hypothetical protein|tara:strand:+ start:513 stop:839 length:327 start_codon:yes stop_codon:yes gene_type:complete